MVGEFYFKREAYLAAAHRFEKIITDFPEEESTGKAMFLLAKTYQKLGIEEWTQEWLVELIRQYPDSPHHSSAQTLLASLQKEYPRLLASLPTNPLLPETTTISASTDSTPPLTPDNTMFTNAGILPDPTIPEAQSSASTEQTATPSPCTIGAWCDSQSNQPPQPPIDSEPLSSQTKACNTGDWC